MHTFISVYYLLNNSIAFLILSTDSALPRTSMISVAPPEYSAFLKLQFLPATSHIRSYNLFLLQIPSAARIMRHYCNHPMLPVLEEFLLILPEVSSLVFIFLWQYIAVSYSGTASKKSIWSLISGRISIRLLIRDAIFFRS